MWRVLLSCAVLTRLLESKGIPLPIAQWLGTSLAPGGRFAGSNSNNNGSSSDNGEQKLDWVFDIQGAAALYNSYRWGGCGWLDLRSGQGALHVFGPNLCLLVHSHRQSALTHTAKQ